MNAKKSLLVSFVGLATSLSTTVTTVAQNPPTPVTENTTQTVPNPSEFSQFRQRLNSAIQRRDAQFIRSLVTPQTQFSYGGSLTLDSYKIDDSQSKFWGYLEKAVNQGCVVDSRLKTAQQEPGSNIWVCPDLTAVQRSITPTRPNFGHLAIIGTNVNVRSEPGLGGRIVGTVSNDYVSFDTVTFGKLSERQKLAFSEVDGWSPVILRTGQKGWIYNRYTYDAENDYRVSFVRSRGQWRLHYFLRGNGN